MSQPVGHAAAFGCIYMNCISDETIFMMTKYEAINRILCINPKGRLWAARVRPGRMSVLEPKVGLSHW